MSGIDASFLYMETPAAHMHVIGLAILDPTSTSSFSFERILHLFETRLHRIPSFRRRVRMVPFGLDHPVWEDDPEFDLEEHFHHVSVPPPGTRHELAGLIGDIAGRPLDRSKPLWEVWLIEGLEGGRCAMVTKVHHSLMDGVSGAAVMTHLLTTSPDEADPPAPSWRPEPSAWSVGLAARALWWSASELGSAAVPLLGGLGKAAWNGLLYAMDGSRRDASAALPFETPIVPWSGAISPHRVAGFGQVSLADLKIVKTTYGTTVNDVVLAACTQSLRDYLLRHDELPEIPLIASVPVAVRGGGEGKEQNNRVSTMFVRLPVQLDDPVEQLRAIRDETEEAKTLHNALGAHLFRELVEFLPPPVFEGGMRLYSSLKLANRHRPPINLVVSNVPGPTIPLYFAGARVEELYPMGPIMDGAGLNLTVLSLMGRVGIGALACREMVPDVEEIATGFERAVARLVGAARPHQNSTSIASR